MKKIFACSALAITFITVHAISLNDITEKLRSADCLKASANYEVVLPSSSEPVTYSIQLLVNENGDDKYSDCDYLIDWELQRGKTSSKGFSAYSNGNHFRYRDSRLQEYHTQSDTVPFTTEGGGVARNAQFTELLPQYLARRIETITNDTSFTWVYNEQTCTLNGVERVHGYDAVEFSYTFNKETGLPLTYDFVYNPGGISEQTVSAKFSWKQAPSPCPTINESYLEETYPAVFQNYRTSNFRVENLRGTPVPTFSYNSPTTGRLSHTRAEADMPGSFIIVFLDRDINDTKVHIEKLREAVAYSGSPLTVIYAFRKGNLPEGWTPLTTEYIMTGADTVIGKCGIYAFPTLLMIDRDGIIENVLVGLPEDIDSLSQALSLL